MELPRLPWYWHVLVAIVLLLVMSAMAIWFDLGPAVHSKADIAGAANGPVDFRLFFAYSPLALSFPS